MLEKIGATIDPETEVRSLSMPEQQLVEIARALGAEARILIMDEPTASLSDKEVDRLFRVIGDLKSHGVGIIYISHRLEELPQIADRVTALRDGVLVGTRRMDEVSRGDLIRMMVGRELSAVFPKTFVEPGEVVLEVRNLGCRAAGVRDVSLIVRAGEILGLAGLVGAGRTELARVLFGLTPADTGLVRLRGQAVAIRSPTRAAALGIAYVPEDRRRHGVILDMTTAANTTLATLRAVSRFGFLDFRRERAIAGEFVRQLGIKTASLETRVGNLSGGNQQKVALARWLAANPALLDPRRADPRGRRRRQGRDPSAHERAGRPRAGHPDDLVRAARDSRHERPDRRDARRHDRRDRRPCRRHPGGDPGAGSGARRAGGSRGMIGRYRRELSVAVAYAALLLILAIAAPRFFLADSLRAFVVSSAPMLVAAVGMTLVILCRQIDISIGSIFSICGVVAGLLAQAGLPIALVATGDARGRQWHGSDQRLPGRPAGLAVDRGDAGHAGDRPRVATLRA